MLAVHFRGGENDFQVWETYHLAFIFLLLKANIGCTVRLLQYFLLLCLVNIYDGVLVFHLQLPWFDHIQEHVLLTAPR